MYELRNTILHDYTEVYPNKFNICYLQGPGAFHMEDIVFPD